MTSTFNLFPFSVDDADIIILNHLEEIGTRFFGDYLQEINNEGNELDRQYFKNYLNYYLFEDILQLDNITMPWESLIYELKTNKNYINLIDFIDDKYKSMFVSNILYMYTKDDIELIALHEKILPYFLEDFNSILDNMYRNKCHNLVAYLSNKSTQDKTLLWLKEYYSENKRYKNFSNLEITEYPKFTKKLNEITKITYQVYDCFNMICSINQNNKISEHSLLKSLFHIIHDFMELSVLNICLLRKTLSEALEEMKERFSEIPEDNLYSRDLLRLKISFFDKMSNELNEITIDETRCMDFFRNYSVEWLYENINNYSHELDDIIGNTIEYMTEERHILYFDRQLFNVCMNILEYDTSKSLTASLGLKCKTIMLISYHFDILDSCVKIYILENLDLFVKNIVHLYIESKNLVDYDIFTYKIEILNMLAGYKETIYHVLDEEIIQRFINQLIDLNQSVFKGLISLVRKFYALDNNIQDEEENTLQDVSKENLLKSMHWYQNVVKMMDLYFIQPSFLERCIDVGNREQMALMIGKKLDILCGSKKKTLAIKQESMYFSPIVHLKNIFNVVYGLCKNPQFQKALVYENHFLKTKYIRKMVEILHRKQEILIREYDELYELAKLIDDGREKEEEERDIPEDLLDPIMGTLIENPVILPNTDMFMEKDVILRHLLTSEDNPFNREPLTKGQLEEYNQQDDVKKKIAAFQERINSIR